MASSGCRTRPRAQVPAIALLAACGAACTAPQPASVSLPQPDPPPISVIEAGIGLPAGAGREILLGSCLSCHDLGGLALFSSFYGREDWRTLVLTMRETGAQLSAAEIDTLADYLSEHFSPGAR